MYQPFRLVKHVGIFSRGVAPGFVVGALQALFGEDAPMY